MKIRLTKEQSQHLINLGLKFPHKIAIHNGANIKTILGEEIPDPNGWYIPINITDLLEMLPKEIMLDKEHGLDFGWDFYANKWVAQYCDEDYLCLYEKAQYYAEELIDALYELTVWCIKNKYLKL